MTSLREAERRKYAKVYEEGVYLPKNSVGARVVPIAYGWARGLGAASVLDWGTGHGRAMRWLRSHGMEAYGLDLVPTKLTRGDARSFLGTLWDPPSDLPTVDFAFSADVLEHVPTERIDESLRHIARRTRVGGWFQIATIPDNLGDEVGETLHETVRPPAWWRHKVRQVFCVVGTEVTEREVRIWVRR